MSQRKLMRSSFFFCFRIKMYFIFRVKLRAYFIFYCFSKYQKVPCSILGIQIWNLVFHIPLVNFTLPRKLPGNWYKMHQVTFLKHLKLTNRPFLDLDGDGIYELVSACAVTLPSEMNDQHSHPRTNFIIVSGKTGNIIGRPYLVK